MNCLNRIQRRFVPVIVFAIFLFIAVLKWNDSSNVGSYLRNLLTIPVPDSFIFINSESSECNPGVPCVYAKEVHFRVIVLTFNRYESVLKLLKSLDDLELDGDTAALEIWIDRDRQGRVDNNTLTTANMFKWKHGPTTVHIQKQHVGIYGQWIDTWRPKKQKSKELAVILEDDLSVSPQIYRWIKSVHKFYGKRKDYAGVTLQTDEQKAHNGGRQLEAPTNHTAFMYKCIGTWGFAPFPKVWSRFQDWYHVHINKTDFHPYVPGIVPTEWYKGFESSGRADSMWEMWFIYFAHIEQLFTVYSNIAAYNGDTESCLSINRREVGLHFDSKGREDLCKLLQTWKVKYETFPSNTIKLDWNGDQLTKYY